MAAVWPVVPAAREEALQALLCGPWKDWNLLHKKKGKTSMLFAFLANIPFVSHVR